MRDCANAKKFLESFEQFFCSFGLLVVFPSTLYRVEANSIITYFIYGHWRSLTLHVILNGRVILSSLSTRYLLEFVLGFVCVL